MSADPKLVPLYLDDAIKVSQSVDDLAFSRTFDEIYDLIDPEHSGEELAQAWGLVHAALLAAVTERIDEANV